MVLCWVLFFLASTDYACTRKRIHEQSPLFHKCRLNHGAKLMSNPSISKGRQNFVTELQILPSCICPIGPKTRMCLLKWIYCVDIIDVFWFSCGNSWYLLKLARVLPKRKDMTLYHLAKYRKMRAMGRVVKDFMRGQDVSQRTCHQRVIAHEKSPNCL